MKSVSEKKSRGHQTSKIIKSNQSCSNGHLPYHCSSLLALSARAQYMAWRGMWICVRSKDAQKRLAPTSLNTKMDDLKNVSKFYFIRYSPKLKLILQLLVHSFM